MICRYLRKFDLSTSLAGLLSCSPFSFWTSAYLCFFFCTTAPIDRNLGWGSRILVSLNFLCEWQFCIVALRLHQEARRETWSSRNALRPLASWHSSDMFFNVGFVDWPAPHRLSFKSQLEPPAASILLYCVSARILPWNTGIEVYSTPSYWLT